MDGSLPDHDVISWLAVKPINNYRLEEEEEEPSLYFVPYSIDIIYSVTEAVNGIKLILPSLPVSCRCEVVQQKESRARSFVYF